MSQKLKNNDLSSKQNQNIENDTPSTISTVKEPTNVKEVKSKIKEEEEDTLGTLQSAKLSGSKIPKYTRHKKPKGKSSVSDIQETSIPESKQETLVSDTSLRSSESKEKIKSIISKKSLDRNKINLDDSISMLSTTEITERSDRKIDGSRNTITTPSAVMNASHIIEVTNLSLPEPDERPSERMGYEELVDQTSQTIIHERGNYMSNAPPPLPLDSEDDTDTPSKDQKET